jgi:hypothetical protein
LILKEALTPLDTPLSIELVIYFYEVLETYFSDPSISLTGVFYLLIAP